MLEKHNQYRARHGAVALMWNGTLAEAATALAQQLCETHAVTTKRSTVAYGESVAVGKETDARIVDRWYTEASGQPYDFANPAPPSATRFTQIVWKGTRQMGCAVASVDMNTGKPCQVAGPKGVAKPSVVQVCEYFPAGNTGDVTEWQLNVAAATQP